MKMTEFRYVTVPVKVRVEKDGVSMLETQQQTFKVEIDFVAAVKELARKAFKNASGVSKECHGALTVSVVQS